MNTKTDGISSGLVAVAWIAPDGDRFRVRICEERPTDAPLWSPMCWISDAEAIISQKDAEIERLKMLAQARGDALMTFAVIREITGTQKATLDDSINAVKAQSAALKLAREALIEMQDLIGESDGVYGLHMNGDVSPWEEVEQGGRFERLTTMPEALAAIDAAMEGK